MQQPLKGLWVLALLFGLQACTVMPQTSGINDSALRSIGASGNVSFIEITPQLLASQSIANVRDNMGCSAGSCADAWDYLIEPGDVLSIVVWEHPQLTIPAGPNRSPEEGGNRVHADGTIFYPYVGRIQVKDHTVAEVREIVAKGLKKVIPNPQVDVSVAHFNENNNVYVLGEIPRPGTQPLGMARLSLTDAVARSGGIDKANANAKGIFVLRAGENEGDMDVFSLDAKSPTAFLWGTRFNLMPQDVVYVTAAPAARWGRLISKIIPSLSALNTLLILEGRL